MVRDETGDDEGDGIPDGTDGAGDGGDGGGRAPRSADLPPGYDEEDPYEGVDLGTYPDWWRENIELFREHGLRPYRPPRFGDGTLTTSRIETLESELGVRVEIRSVNPQHTSASEVVVDGEPIATIERSRESDGHTEYDVTATEFEAIVQASISPDGSVGDDPESDR